MKLKLRPGMLNVKTTLRGSLLRVVLPSLCLFVSGQCVYATAQTADRNVVSARHEKVSVNGTIVGKNGEPLIGVSVVENGTSNGVVSDINGYFSIKVKPGATLKLTYIGYQPQEVAVNGQSSFDVTMQEDTEMLDEVVVVGYGSVRKADLAGSVAVLDNKSFRDQPITQVSDALQGRVAGVNVVSDGLPGGSVKIRIRGTNSINKSNDPLYVVDGMVRESGLDGINPEDIQSMQILKDASSTAIYGSRGANGVVIITTKGGVAGQTSITFDAQVGISQAYNLPEMMDTKSYAQALIDYNGISQADVADYLNGTNPGIDWVDQIFRTGITQNYKLVFSKGTEDLQMYFSGNYMKHEGVIEATQYERFSAKANVRAKFTDWLNVNVDMNASRGIGKGGGGMVMSAANPLWVAFNSSPTMNMYDDNGNFATDPYSTIQQNPYGLLTACESERRRDVLNGHVDLQFNIIDGLTFTTSNGIDYYNNTYYTFSPTEVYGPGQSSMTNDNVQRVLLQSTNNITYTHIWNDKHHLTATGVWEATKSTTRSMGITGDDLLAESVGYWDVKNAASRDASNGYTEWSLLSGVARVIYNFDDRYLLTGTLRADGSSRFSDNKWGVFPSIAAAWTISNEKFMENARRVMNNLKLRVSYGVIGNQDIDPFSTLGLLSATTTYFGTSRGVTGYWINSIETPDIKWEKTRQFDVGLDFGFLDNRIGLSIDYYNKRTTDALLYTTLADYLGGTRYLINAGEVANSGFDIAISANIIDNKDWSWTTSINGSYLKNEVKKLTAQEPIIYGGSFQSVITDCTIIKEGEAIGTFYGYEWAGIDAEGYDTYRAADGSITRNPGTADRVVLGKASPDFTFGWNNMVRFKNWTLNAFFNASFGAQRLNALRFAMNSKIGNSRMFTAAGYIEQIGTTMPDPNVTNNNYLGNSSKWVEDANYLRCENITLAYELPKRVAKIADFRFSFSVQNLFTISGYKGADPAGFPFSEDYGDRAAGIDTGTHPVPRTYTFGVRMNF